MGSGEWRQKRMFSCGAVCWAGVTKVERRKIPKCCVFIGGKIGETSLGQLSNSTQGLVVDNSSELRGSTGLLGASYLQDAFTM